MMKFLILVTLLVSFFIKTEGQVFPVFGPEKPVTISGLTFDAMEPFISPDGNILFFNSINSGGNTNLYFALKVSDTLFIFQGPVEGCLDTTLNHLDAVASMDIYGNFYWVSLRHYPDTLENFHSGNYSFGNVTEINRVYGSFNINTLGWIIMDACINRQGDKLLYSNSYFDFISGSCGGLPCSSGLGIAERVNDTIFNKSSDSENMLCLINDTNYLVYAPQISDNELELYFTRLLKGTFNTEICISVRNNPADTFSVPHVIYSDYGYFPEAPTLTQACNIMYYHKKNQLGLYSIYMRYRDAQSEIIPNKSDQTGIIYDPLTKDIKIIRDFSTSFQIELYNSSGQMLMSENDNSSISMNQFGNGVFLVVVKNNNAIVKKKVVVYYILKNSDTFCRL